MRVINCCTVPESLNWVRQSFIIERILSPKGGKPSWAIVGDESTDTFIPAPRPIEGTFNECVKTTTKPPSFVGCVAKVVVNAELQWALITYRRYNVEISKPNQCHYALDAVYLFDTNVQLISLAFTGDRLLWASAKIKNAIDEMTFSGSKTSTRVWRHSDKVVFEVPVNSTAFEDKVQDIEDETPPETASLEDRVSVDTITEKEPVASPSRVSWTELQRTTRPTITESKATPQEPVSVSTDVDLSGIRRLLSAMPADVLLTVRDMVDRQHAVTLAKRVLDEVAIWESNETELRLNERVHVLEAAGMLSRMTGSSLSSPESIRVATEMLESLLTTK